MIKLNPWIVIALCMWLPLGPVHAELQVASIFGDHMVLQRHAAVPIWGRADAGAVVHAEVGGVSYEASADAKGFWMLRIDPMPAGGPYELRIRSQDAEITFQDVLVGEVWLASGQSNMAWPVSRSMGADEEVAAADFPQIRLMTVPQQSSQVPQDDQCGTWTPVTPGSVESFSAVAYYFGRQLHQDLEVPIGLINASWGATFIEGWISHRRLQATPEAAPILARFQSALQRYPQAMAAYRKALDAWEARVPERPSVHIDEGNQGEAMGFADPDYDDSDWERAKVPGPWEALGHDIDGAVWFRRAVDVPAEHAGATWTLELGPVDEFDTTYVNARQVGAIGPEREDAWITPRRYRLPDRSIRPGRNIIAVRIFDHFGPGGFTGRPEELRLTSDAGLAIPLAGEWQMRIEKALDPAAISGPGQPGHPSEPVGPEHRHAPAGLFNAMIHPIIPYGIAGVIWYQGEANVGRAEQYRTLLPALIEDWREQWANADMPFLFVQLPNYGEPSEQPSDPEWAHLRDAQLHALRTVPKTGMAIAIDVGAATSIHPLDKQTVGGRLARWALADVYGQPLTRSGPIARGVRPDGAAMFVTFDTFGSTLAARSELVGFIVAGEDQRWRPAKAEVIGVDTVRVWSENVPHPIAVRYAWANNPVSANLSNDENLPASPFRSDDWPGPTDGQR